MKTLCIANQKGGAGKSTLAAHISVLAEADGARVLLIDIDPQRSLARWWNERAAETPKMIECPPEGLSRISARARLDGIGLIIIDTPAQVGPPILHAMRAADLVLVPTRPSAYDLFAIKATLDLARQARRSPLVILNAAPVAAGFGEPAHVTEARTALQRMGATVANTIIAQRIALAHAINSGLTVGEYEPSGKAAKEIRALWRELQPMIEE